MIEQDVLVNTRYGRQAAFAAYKVKPGYIGFAEIDPAVPANVVPDLEAALKTAGAKYRMETYKGVHHGFCFANRPDYDPVAAEESWTRVFDLWDRNLK